MGANYHNQISIFERGWLQNCSYSAKYFKPNFFGKFSRSSLSSEEVNEILAVKDPTVNE